MLVLTRKSNERLVIGDSIVVTVLQIGRGRVRLGIEAPAEYRILREGLSPKDGRPAPAAQVLDMPAVR
jgi:carbon storage regulator